MQLKLYVSTLSDLHKAISTMTTPESMIWGGATMSGKKRYYLSFENGNTSDGVETTGTLYHLFFNDDGYYYQDRRTRNMYCKDAALLVLLPLLRTQKLASLGIN